MLQAFIIVLREGFEGFLIAAIILSYLEKRGEKTLIPAVYWGVGVSLLVSAIAGFLLREGIHQSLWEGILGVVTIISVGWLVIHMWRVGAKMKSQMESQLTTATSNVTHKAAYLAVFLFTVLNITREGMETAIMLIQVRMGRFTIGILLGLAAAMGVSYLWTRCSHLINVRRFFQVTGVFLLLFLVQVAIYSFHEFAEAGVLPNSEFLHDLTERFSPDGFYGKWFSPLMILVCALWFVGSWLMDRYRSKSLSGSRA